MDYKRIEHIAAGQFKAGPAKNDVYQAYLGTCVGLALYDRAAKIGGLIHILLPEPPTFSNTLFPKKYASSGVPMLIRKVLDLGATPENLEASIAGGALVGPVSQQDINLDIGGRTTDITLAILEAAKIKIKKSETGGFFTCTLELDMATGQTRIKPAWDEYDEQDEVFKVPTLDDILATLDDLKPIPQTALKIMRMFQTGMGGITDIADELAKDQVLSAQTLKICNSALFSGSAKVETLKDAVLLMGEDMLIKSVITAAVNAYYGQAGTSGYSLCKGGLFFHAVGVASLAEKISEKTGKSSPKLAYTAGLLHDIGKVVLDQYVAEAAPLFFRQISRDDQDSIGAEKKLAGISHTEAGALLAKQWQFSPGLARAVRFHHTPDQAPKDRDLVNIIYLADLIIGKFTTGFDVRKISSDNLSQVLSDLGLTADVLPELADAIPVNAFDEGDY